MEPGNWNNSAMRADSMCSFRQSRSQAMANQNNHTPTKPAKKPRAADNLKPKQTNTLTGAMLHHGSHWRATKDSKAIRTIAGNRRIIFSSFEGSTYGYLVQNNKLGLKSQLSLSLSCSKNFQPYDTTHQRMPSHQHKNARR